MSAAITNNDEVSSGQPVERHGGTHSMMRSINSSSGRSQKSCREQVWLLCRRPELNGSPTLRGGGGTGLVELVIYVYDGYTCRLKYRFWWKYEVYLFTARVETRE